MQYMYKLVSSCLKLIMLQFFGVFLLNTNAFWNLLFACLIGLIELISFHNWLM